MKKVLLSLLLVVACMGSQAQRGNVYNDKTLFVSLGVGGTYYQNSGSGQFAMPSVSLSLGRWLMRPLAFRLSGDVIMAPSYYQFENGGSTTFYMGRAQFLWDVNATFFHVYNKTFLYPFPVYPMIGLGVVVRPEVKTDNISQGVDHDVQTMLGFHMPVRLNKHLSLFLEYKCFFFPQAFDGSGGDKFMHTFNGGLTFRWGDNPFNRTTAFESRSTRDDWFVGFGAGVSFSSFEFENIAKPSARLWNPTPEIMVGRNYSHVWTIRFELSGFFARERAHEELDMGINDDGSFYSNVTMHPGKWYTYNMLHTDFMINLTHLLGFKRGTRWNILPYLGAGPVWRYRSKPAFDLGADFGIMARRFMDNMGDFYIDLKYLMVPPRIAGSTGSSGSYLGVGFPTLTIGYIFNFEHSTTRYRMPVNSTIN